MAPTLAAALAIALSYPPVGIASTTWLGAALLWWALEHATVLRGGLRGLVLGLVLAATIGAWLPQVLSEAFGADAIGACALWVAAAFSFAPGFALLGAAAGVARGRWHRVLVVGVGWGLVEVSHARVFPGVPWVVLAAPLVDEPAIARFAGAIGVHGVSSLVSTSGACLAALATQGRWTPAVVLAAALVALGWLDLGIGAGREGGSLRIAAVQPALPMLPSGDPRYDRHSVERLVELTEGLRNLDLVVWPESALRSSVGTKRDLEREIERVARHIDAPILYGGYRGGASTRWNSAIWVEPAGTSRVVYDKRRLLPFAESVPSWVSPAIRRSLGHLVPAVPQRAGAHRQRETRIPGRAAILICYEAIFSERGDDPRSGLLLDLVNDAWYDATPAAAQHLLLSRWRAIEAGAPLVRVAYTGTTAVVEPSGRISARLPSGAAGVIIAEVRRVDRITVFETLGYAPHLAGGALVGALLYVRRRDSRSTTPSRSR